MWLEREAEISEDMAVVHLHHCGSESVHKKFIFLGTETYGR
jgi:hypothetical protein